jgi:hypothetical protein
VWQSQQGSAWHTFEEDKAGKEAAAADDALQHKLRLLHREAVSVSHAATLKVYKGVSAVRRAHDIRRKTQVGQEIERKNAGRAAVAGLPGPPTPTTRGFLKAAAASTPLHGMSDERKSLPSRHELSIGPVRRAEEIRRERQVGQEREAGFVQLAHYAYDV